MIKAGIQNSINMHQEKLDNLRDSYCKLKYQEETLLTQCQDTKEAPISKDSYTYLKLPDMHQSDPEGHTLTVELRAFDYKPTLAAWDDHYVEYEETIKAVLEEEEEVEEPPTKKRKDPPPTAKKGKKGKGMFEKDERVEVESSDSDKPIKWWKATIVTTSCPGKISHYKVLYDEPEDDSDEDRLEPVPVRRISKLGEAGQKRRDEYVRKF